MGGVCGEQGTVGAVHAAPPVTRSVKTFIQSNIATPHGGEGRESLTRQISRSSPGRAVGPPSTAVPCCPGPQDPGF